MIRKILIGLAVIVVGLQFFRGTPPEVMNENSGDLLANYEISPEVENILKSACYDCHSNETHYPWYSYVTPVSWFLFKHIREGRDELNFSEWSTMRGSRQIRKLKEIGEEVSEGGMPLKSYTIIHGSARLTPEQREMITNWAETFDGGGSGEQ